MKRNFTFKEAKTLYLYVKSKLHDIDDSFETVKVITFILNNNLSEAVKKGAFHQYVDRLFSENRTINHDSKNKIARCISAAIESKEIYTTCLPYINEHKSQSLYCYLSTLHDATGPLRWFFSSSKKDAIDAFYMIGKTMNDPEFIRILNCSKKIDAIYNCEVIEYDDQTYFDYLNNNYLPNIIDINLEPKVQCLLSKYKGVNQSIERLKVIKEDKIKTANKIIEKILTVSAINKLSEISVEELRKAKSGIRVKVLLDHKIYTLKDAYEKFNNISRYQRFGYDQIYLLKDILDKYIREFKQIVGVQLSSDKKTDNTSELVTYLYDIKAINEALKNVKGVMNIDGDWIESSTETLKKYGNGVLLAFANEEIISEFLNAYHFLEDNTESGYIDQILSITKPLAKPHITPSNVAWLDFENNPIIYNTLLGNINPYALGQAENGYQAMPDFLKNEIEAVELDLKGLTSQLRQYQTIGVKYIIHQKRVLIGDEMGLGKTVEAIASFVHLRNKGATHFLVVCPAGVLINWYREVLRHSDLRCMYIHGQYAGYFIKNWINNGGVAVTTYETCKKIKFDNDFRFDAIVMDEAHYIKNPNANRTIHAKRLASYANNVIFMTGTALENNVYEMLELLSYLRPDISNKASNLAHVSQAPSFRKEIAPVYLRRKREDVLNELPDLIEEEAWCSLSKEEERVYAQTIFSHNYMKIRQLSWNMDNLEMSTKANRMLEIIDDARLENRKVLVFSYFLETLAKIKKLLGHNATEIINGSVPSQKRQEIIDRFESAPAGTALLAQITSGGTGLNIQAASVVIICEPQFKPSTENQAISRAYRMGQARNVLVFRLLCENTVDERITEILKAKQLEFNAFADKSVAGQNLPEIDTQTLSDLIKQEEERLKNEGFESSNDNYVDREDNDYLSLLDMKYDDIISLMLSRHGAVPGDYFVNKECRSKNKKISRASEGLYCHHIDEDKAIDLSKTDLAVKHPWEYQTASHLVYCDILEHLIIHIKIMEEHTSVTNDNYMLGIGGVFSIIPTLNDCLDGMSFNYEYQIKNKELVSAHFQDYVVILKYLINVLKDKYSNISTLLLNNLYLGSKQQKVEIVYDALKDNL